MYLGSREKRDCCGEDRVLSQVQEVERSEWDDDSEVVVSTKERQRAKLFPLLFQGRLPQDDRTRACMPVVLLE